MREEGKAIAMPQDERDKVKIKGYFHNEQPPQPQTYTREDLERIVGDLGRGNYKGDIYNGTSWTINKLRLSIGAKDKEGKIQWQKTYEVSIYIEPFSIGYCSIKLMDSNYFTPNAKADALGAPKEKEEASGEGALRARKQSSDLEAKPSQGHIIPKELIVFDEPLSPEVKIEDIFGYKGE
jgi:hypothetical protein